MNYPRRMYGLFWVVLGATLVGGCEAHQCTLADCGSTTEVSLVNEQGEPVRARGEHRIRGYRHDSAAQSFDCTTSSSGCEQGVLHVYGPEEDRADLELRFELPDGTFTVWQTFTLAVTPKTDPDFNGPDCPCTWYEAAPVEVMVPEAAQLD